MSDLTNAEKMAENMAEILGVMVKDIGAKKVSVETFAATLKNELVKRFRIAANENEAVLRNRIEELELLRKFPQSKVEAETKNLLEQELLKNQSYSNQQRILTAEVKELEETCGRWEKLYDATRKGEKQALTEAFMLREALKATNMYFVCTAASADGSMAHWDGNPGMLGQKLDQLNGSVLNTTPKAETLGELMRKLQERLGEISDMSITSERDQRKRGQFRDWKDIAREAQRDLKDFFGEEQVQLNGP